EAGADHAMAVEDDDGAVVREGRDRRIVPVAIGLHLPRTPSLHGPVIVMRAHIDKTIGLVAICVVGLLEKDPDALVDPKSPDTLQPGFALDLKGIFCGPCDEVTNWLIDGVLQRRGQFAVSCHEAWTEGDASRLHSSALRTQIGDCF